MISPESILVHYFSFLESKGKTYNILVGIAWTALFGILDMFASPNVSFSFLYLFPIAFVTWFGGNRAGFLIALTCGTLWSADDIMHHNVFSVWNILSTFAVFCTVSVVLSKTHDMWVKQKELSENDPLTGVLNIRAFSELVEYEIFRHQREDAPFSIAYLDIDNFKAVNDRFGHKRGDDLLKSVVMNIVESLRKTDVVARVGGDEFIIFLPATDHVAVKTVMEKVWERLHTLTESDHLETTFSIGVITYSDRVCRLEEIISIADSLMYEVKNSGKNNIRYARQDYINEKQYSLPLT